MNSTNNRVPFLNDAPMKVRHASTPFTWVLLLRLVGVAVMIFLDGAALHQPHLHENKSLWENDLGFVLICCIFTLILCYIFAFVSEEESLKPILYFWVCLYLFAEQMFTMIIFHFSKASVWTWHITTIAMVIIKILDSTYVSISNFLRKRRMMVVCIVALTVPVFLGVEAERTLYLLVNMFSILANLYLCDCYLNGISEEESISQTDLGAFSIIIFTYTNLFTRVLISSIAASRRDTTMAVHRSEQETKNSMHHVSNDD